MGIRFTDIVRLHVPFSTARKALSIGKADHRGRIAGETHSFSAGADLTPLLTGLEQGTSLQWGYLLTGELLVDCGNGWVDTIEANELFYLPAGRPVRAGRDCEVFLFSPVRESRESLQQVATSLREAVQAARRG